MNESAWLNRSKAIPYFDDQVARQEGGDCIRGLLTRDDADGGRTRSYTRQVIAASRCEDRSKESSEKTFQAADGPSFGLHSGNLG